MGRMMQLLHKVTGWDLFLELIALLALAAIGVIAYLVAG
jgi:hypothetical protein